MIPTYKVEDLTGGIDLMFQNIMRICFLLTLSLLTIWIILSLLIWLFRSKKEIRKSNKIWYKELYNNFRINNYYTINSTIY